MEIKILVVDDEIDFLETTVKRRKKSSLILLEYPVVKMPW